ncbi:MAG: hypothetical protein Q9164_003459 [Protoblastenia rupestris]
MKRHIGQTDPSDSPESSDRSKFVKQEAVLDMSLSHSTASGSVGNSNVVKAQPKEQDTNLRGGPIKQESSAPDSKILQTIEPFPLTPSTTGEDLSRSSRTRSSSMSTPENTPTIWLGDKRADTMKAYKAANKRLLIFDYDGTLTPIIENPSEAFLPIVDTHALHALAKHPKNSVWIVSGRNQGFLTSQADFGHDIGLTAEHGAFVRQPGSHQWANLAKDIDMTWKKPVRKVYKGLCEAIPESWVEEKKAAMVWHYRANQEDGEAMAPGCRQLLEQRAQRSAWAVRVTAGKCIVEVRPDMINKGCIVNELLDKFKRTEGHFPEFVLCVGDDDTDEGKIMVSEVVFRVLTYGDMFAAAADSDLPLEYNFCTKIGTEGKTRAIFNLLSPEDLFGFIRKFNSHDASGN